MDFTRLLEVVDDEPVFETGLLLAGSIRHYNALQQTGWAGAPVTEQNWRVVVRDRLQSLAWDQVVADVRPFLEPSANLDLLTLENVMRVLG